MEEKISKIIDVLIANEDMLSDGFGYYCGVEIVEQSMWIKDPKQAAEQYKANLYKALEPIAIQILQSIEG